METSSTVSTNENTDVDPRGWKMFNQAIGQVAEFTEPASRWSKQVLAQAERKAAKGLWSAAAQLGRAAHRLDAAGRALESSSANGKVNLKESTMPDADENVMGDEFNSPHLA